MSTAFAARRSVKGSEAEFEKARPASSSPMQQFMNAAAVHERRTVRRRGSLAQGRALEKLGHAVDYLVDSRLFLLDTDMRSDQEALQTLMRLSRMVFSECPETVSVWQRVGRFCRRSFARQ